MPSYSLFAVIDFLAGVNLNINKNISYIFVIDWRKMEKKAYIDPGVCVGSPFCLTYIKCPNDAIIREPVDFEERYFDISNEGGGPMVSRVIIEKCKACGTCVAVCPHMAAKLRE